MRKDIYDKIQEIIDHLKKEKEAGKRNNNSDDWIEGFDYALAIIQLYAIRTK